MSLEGGTGGAEPRGGGPRRPRGGALGSGIVAPLLAVVGLIVITLGSIYVISIFPLTTGSAPATPTLGPGQTEGPPPVVAPPSANPSVVVTPPPDLRPTIKGTLLFTRTGNIWAASGLSLTQISNQGTDSDPVWSPDGQKIYFLAALEKVAQPPWGGSVGNASKYTFDYQNIDSMSADGTSRKQIYNAYFKSGGGFWFTTIAQPDISPDGQTLAFVSDGGYVPNSNNNVQDFGPVVLYTMPAAGGKLQNLNIRNQNGLGHNDPAWSPDGTQIAFTFNGKQGATGAPRIGLYTVATHKLTLLPPKGYADPSWSSDGKYIAAEQTTGNGRDIVVLDPSTGAEVAQLTTDGNSFGPTFSPDGDQIAYLHRQNLGVDLRVLTLDLSSGSITLVKDQPITQDGSLDPTSRPAWFIPPDQRTTPSSGPSSSQGPLPSAGASTTP